MIGAVRPDSLQDGPAFHSQFTACLLSPSVHTPVDTDLSCSPNKHAPTQTSTLTAPAMWDSLACALAISLLTYFLQYSLKCLLRGLLLSPYKNEAVSQSLCTLTPSSLALKTREH